MSAELIRCYLKNFFLFCVIFFASFIKLNGQSVKPSYSAEAVLGGLANLPCDITPPQAGDKMHILIWYKDKTPIYTFDSRGKNLEEGKHWSSEFLGERAFFRFQDEVAKLILNGVKESDAGIYHCRVDFRRSPTRNVVVNLTIITPPEKIIILNERGTLIQHYILGPYNEGSTVNITCVATGGRPPPKVSWWQENALVDDTYEYLSERRVRNILYVNRLERKHLHCVFTCQASNNNLIAPISTSVTVDMNLRPLSVKLLGVNKPLSAGNTYEFSCEVIGSRPAPTITWWRGGRQLTDTRETTSPDNNVTTSVVTYTPSVKDGNKFLYCRAQQPLIPNSLLEDGWKLDIYYSPIVSLSLGSNIDVKNIKEGGDVYFVCNIKANPWVYKISWKHNDKMVYSNVSMGIIIANYSLVLQSLNRNQAGNYTCMGSNHEGMAESNEVPLNINSVAVCKPKQQKIYYVARHETVSVLCELEANPANLKFFWKFNNSNKASSLVDIPPNLVATDKRKSTLLYTPTSEHDYGTLLCEATNEVGSQREPCVFYIIPADKPNPLTNCTAMNQTATSIEVECLEGFDGGLTQIFVMEVYDVHQHFLVNNVTSNIPVFFVGGLAPNTNLDLIMYAFNKKGKSDIRNLHTFTLKSSTKIYESGLYLHHLAPILGVTLGIVITLIIIATAIVIVIRLRGADGRDNKQYDCNSISTSGSTYLNSSGKNSNTVPPKSDISSSLDNVDEKNPDIIPQSSEEDLLDEERAFERLNNTQPRTCIRLHTPHDEDINQGFNYGSLENSRNVHSQVFYSQQPSCYFQSFSPISSPTLQRVNHCNLAPLTYEQCRPRDKQFAYEESVSSITPLISAENNTMVTRNHQSPLFMSLESHGATRF